MENKAIDFNELSKAYSQSHQDFNDFIKQPVPNSHSTPRTISKWYSNEISLVTSGIADFEKASNLHPLCKNGCSYCCKQAIVISYPELLAIKPVFKNLSIDTQNRILYLCQCICGILKNNGLSENAVSCLQNHEEEIELQRKYFSLKISCPFLDNQNSCMIYPVRPTLCWSYKYYGTNIHDCEDSFAPSLSFQYSTLNEMIEKKLFSIKRISERRTLQLLPFAIANIEHI